MEPNNNRFEIKPYTLGELSNVYSVSPRTMKRWLEPHLNKIGPRNGRFFTALQVSIIVELIGWPRVLEEE